MYRFPRCSLLATARLPSSLVRAQLPILTRARAPRPDIPRGYGTEDPPPQMFNLKAVLHFRSYGRRGSPPPQRVTKKDWQVKPYAQPVTSPWALDISPATFAVLLQGYRPIEMEDKWFVYAEGVEDAPATETTTADSSNQRFRTGSDARSSHTTEPRPSSSSNQSTDTATANDGVVTVHFLRSWTSFPIGSIRMRPSKDGGASFYELTWESSEERLGNSSEGLVKEMLRNVCSWVLGSELPAEEGIGEDEAARAGRGELGGR